MVEAALTLDLTMPTKVQAAAAYGEGLAERIGSGQRAASHYGTVAEFPPTSVVVQLAEVLKVSTDERLGVKPSKKATQAEGSELRRLWKRCQQAMTHPEKNRRAVIRLVNSLVAAKRSGAA